MRELSREAQGLFWLRWQSRRAGGAHRGALGWGHPSALGFISINDLGVLPSCVNYGHWKIEETINKAPPTQELGRNLAAGVWTRSALRSLPSRSLLEFHYSMKVVYLLGLSVAAKGRGLQFPAEFCAINIHFHREEGKYKIEGSEKMLGMKLIEGKMCWAEWLNSSFGGRGVSGG